MQRKHFLLTAAALALLGAPQAGADGVYLSFFGGGNLLQDESHAGTGGNYNSSGRNTFDSDTSFALGAAVGMSLENWLKGLRAEIEASYRRGDLEGDWTEYTSFYNTTDSGTLDGNLSTFAVMANVAYDIDIGSKFKPYVMVGAGWARTHIEGNLNDYDFFLFGNPSFDADNSGFAWQLGAGLNYPVAPGVEVGMGYRYFDAPEASYFAGKNSIADRHDNDSHTVMLNLTITTN
jgi:opacity protein-like surface antigen